MSPVRLNHHRGTETQRGKSKNGVEQRVCRTLLHFERVPDTNRRKISVLLSVLSVALWLIALHKPWEVLGILGGLDVNGLRVALDDLCVLDLAQDLAAAGEEDLDLAFGVSDDNVALYDRTIRDGDLDCLLLAVAG